MNKIKVVKVSNTKGLPFLQSKINKELDGYSDDEYRVINVQVIDDKSAFVMLQSKY